MCSTGSEGRITISEAAYERVMTTTYLFSEKKVYAKGKGDLSTFLVTIRKIEPRRRWTLPNTLSLVIPMDNSNGHHQTRAPR